MKTEDINKLEEILPKAVPFGTSRESQEALAILRNAIPELIRLAKIGQRLLATHGDHVSDEDGCPA